MASKVNAALALVDSEPATDRPIVNALIDQRVANVKREHTNLLRQISAMQKQLEQLTGTQIVPKKTRRNKRKKETLDTQDDTESTHRHNKRPKPNQPHNINPVHPNKTRQQSNQSTVGQSKKSTRGRPVKPPTLKNKTSHDPNRSASTANASKNKRNLNRRRSKKTLQQSGTHSTNRNRRR